MTLDLLSGLSRDLSWLLGDSDDHDILIHAGEAPNTKGFKAHINILRARSLYFRAVLSSKKHPLTASSIIVTPPSENSPDETSNDDKHNNDNNNNNNSSNNNNNVDNNNDALNDKSNSATAIDTARGDKEWYQLNISPETFEVMLRFMYSGRIDLDAGTDTRKIFDYLLAADILWLYQLLEHLQLYLIRNRSKWLQQNFVHVFSFVHTNPNTFKRLNQYSQSTLFTQPQLLFDSPQYHTLTPETIIFLLKKGHVQIEESELWAKVLEWGVKQDSEIANKGENNLDPEDCVTLQRILSKFFPLIRFERMNPEDFNEKIRPYKSIFPVELYEKISGLLDIENATFSDSAPENSHLQGGTADHSQVESPSNETLMTPSIIIPILPFLSSSPSMQPVSPTEPISPTEPVSPISSISPTELTLPPPPPPVTSIIRPTNLVTNPSSHKKGLTVWYHPSSISVDKDSRSLRTVRSKYRRSTIINRQYLALISGWIDGRDLSSPENASYGISEVPYKFKLLCRGTRHGFSDKVFHKRCDYKGPTITVIKLEGVEGVIGGYNPLNWQSPWIRKFEECHHSFIFSVCVGSQNSNDDGKDTKKQDGDGGNLNKQEGDRINQNLIVSTAPVKSKSVFSRAVLSKYAISLHRSTGPAFGTTDLVMKDGIVKWKSECYALNLPEGSNLTGTAGSSKAHRKNDGEENIGSIIHGLFNKSASDLTAHIFNSDGSDNYFDAGDKSYMEFDEMRADLDPLTKPYHYKVEEYEVYAVMGRTVVDIW